MYKFRKRNVAHELFVGLFMLRTCEYTCCESRYGDPITWLTVYTENAGKISKYVVWRPCDIAQWHLGQNRKITHGICRLCFLQSSMEMTRITRCHCFENHSKFTIQNLSHDSLRLESAVNTLRTGDADLRF